MFVLRSLRFGRLRHGWKLLQPSETLTAARAPVDNAFLLSTVASAPHLVHSGGVHRPRSCTTAAGHNVRHFTSTNTLLDDSPTTPTLELSDFSVENNVFFTDQKAGQPVHFTGSALAAVYAAYRLPSSDTHNFNAWAEQLNEPSTDTTLSEAEQCEVQRIRLTSLVLRHIRLTADPNGSEPHEHAEDVELGWAVRTAFADWMKAHQRPLARLLLRGRATHDVHLEATHVDAIVQRCTTLRFKPGTAQRLAVLLCNVLNHTEQLLPPQPSLLSMMHRCCRVTMVNAVHPTDDLPQMIRRLYHETDLAPYAIEDLVLGLGKEQKARIVVPKVAEEEKGEESVGRPPRFSHRFYFTDGYSYDDEIGHYVSSIDLYSVLRKPESLLERPESLLERTMYARGRPAAGKTTLLFMFGRWMAQALSKGDEDVPSATVYLARTVRPPSCEGVGERSGGQFQPLLGADRINAVEQELGKLLLKIDTSEEEVPTPDLSAPFAVHRAFELFCVITGDSERFEEFRLNLLTRRKTREEDSEQQFESISFDSIQELLGKNRIDLSEPKFRRASFERLAGMPVASDQPDNIYKVYRKLDRFVREYLALRALVGPVRQLCSPHNLLEAIDNDARGSRSFVFVVSMDDLVVEDKVTQDALFDIVPVLKKELFPQRNRDPSLHVKLLMVLTGSSVPYYVPYYDALEVHCDWHHSQKN